MIKLYCVVASEPLPAITAAGAAWANPDSRGLWTALMGSHDRAGARSPHFLRVPDICQAVSTYLKVKKYCVIYSVYQ